jgi:hypothetical protein
MWFLSGPGFCLVTDPILGNFGWQMMTWTRTRVEDIRAAREAYDSRQDA